MGYLADTLLLVVNHRRVALNKIRSMLTLFPRAHILHSYVDVHTGSTDAASSQTNHPPELLSTHTLP